MIEVTDEEVRAFMEFLVKEARASLDADKQLIKDNIALKSEIQRLRAKLTACEAEIDRVGRERAT